MSYRGNYFHNPYLFLLQVCWRYAGKMRFKYAIIYTAFALSNLVQAALPVIWGVYINDLQQNGTDALRRTWIYALVYLGVKLADWSFHGPARIVERKLAFFIAKNFMEEYYHKVLQLPVKWQQDHHSGEIINRIRKAYESIRNFFERGFEYVHTLAKFFISFAAMLYFSPLFGGVAVVLGIIVIFTIFQFDKPYIKTLEEVNEEEHKVSASLFDSLSNVVTVITLRLQSRLQQTLISRIMAVWPPFRKNVSVNEWKWFVTDMLVALIYVVILIGYVWQNWQPGQVMLLGGLVTLMGYVERFTSVFHNVAYLYTDVVKDATNVRTAFIISEAYDQHHLPENDTALHGDWQKIEIKNLSFSHKGNEDFLPADINTEKIAGLHNIHLMLQRGKRIALIGESGSGKSTLLAVLRGLYPATQSASINIDGIAQPGGINMIASHVTLFPQEPEIFENTIEYNITLGVDYSNAEIESICSAVQFWEVVKQLPKGLQSNIAEKGVNLSGGQKQRLALARGMLAAKDSDIILLDEPTSSVDPKTELKIYEHMFALFKNKVVVSALHRLHLLKYFDHICVIEGGCIVVEGSLEYLLNNSETFKELWKHQQIS
ncbi:ABC transporter ATP-binding protein [Terrimonas sp.]|uniref:ABC transporter ATP-binding protein n=1 Tax=Terrimonas sp. TaxID=1914338 RepID=UPI000D512ADA|nr:ABC transporter ATP-binding protein [Terrimonas sp.]PVD53746.1 ABC transporter ATP-binding protein [Terrimonas sp.]